MKNDIQTILEIFYYKIVKEAKEGCILVNDWQYHMRFFVPPFTKSDGTASVLHIHDEAKFQKLLAMYTLLTEKYLQDHPKFQIDQYIVNRYFEAFGRLNYHFPEFEILNFPMQTSSSITFEISSPSIDSDDFLHQISNSIICQSKIKRNGLL